MIGYLKGDIIYKDLKFLIVNAGESTNGVGYKVYITPDFISETETGSHIDIWIHTVVKDDAIDLYGFKNKGSLDFFDLLLSVSGIGPKSALNILGLANTNNLRKAIVSQDTSYLTSVSGISKKIAEKIVMELKGKFLGGFDEDSNDNESMVYNKQGRSVEVETLEALKALGYTQKEAREALENVSKEVRESKDVGTILKATLKVLS
ncbi:MAG: Holliday junction branch migration protein RuvA [bacterium]